MTITRTSRVVVIGAGIGGLTAAALLSAHGLDVTVIERHPTTGGRMRQIRVGNALIDSGPTVLTMRPVFEALFRDAGSDLAAHITLRPASVLARHAWSADERLDLHADIDQSADAISQFAGPREGQGYRRFCAATAAMFRTLERPFLEAHAPSFAALAGIGLRNPAELWRIRSFTTLWQDLGSYFNDQRLRQLFGRYATYCGSSPFLTPGTLMLIAHVEQNGVWLVEGGMQNLAKALQQVCTSNGATIRTAQAVASIMVEHGRAAGVTLEDGERIAADAVISNADTAGLAAGLLGASATRALSRTHPRHRSLSALTWSMTAQTSGFPLAHHTVFFSNNYRAEFDDIFSRRRLPRQPTIYVCAQDRDDVGALTSKSGAGERLFCLANAPPTGDSGPFDPSEIMRCETESFNLLKRCGLQLDPSSVVRTEPADFSRMFPGSGGALYGKSSHRTTALARTGTRSRIPGLYLAGGGVHPGAGLPMVALSGRHAVEALLADLTSRGR